MKLWMDLVFFIVIGYVGFRFFQMLVKMRGRIVFPISEEERALIRKHPEKPVAPPTVASQKAGIIIQCALFLFVLVLFFVSVFTDFFTWSVYLLLFLPIAHSANLLNLFAVVEDGIISGNRFVSWKNIHSFQFIPIDVNHKFYGYSKEMNTGGYELKMKTKGFPIGCLVSSAQMKEKLTAVLQEYGELSQSNDSHAKTVVKK